MKTESTSELLQLVSPLLPNLDGFLTADQAKAACLELHKLSDGIRKLADYAEAKAGCMELRARGEIEKARRFEAAAEFVYSSLPQWAKW